MQPYAAQNEDYAKMCALCLVKAQLQICGDDEEKLAFIEDATNAVSRQIQTFGEHAVEQAYKRYYETTLRELADKKIELETPPEAPPVPTLQLPDEIIQGLKLIATR